MTADPFISLELPHALEAEKSILGAILLNPALIDEAIEHLECEAFYLVSHRRIFNAMRQLAARGVVIEFPALVDELRARQEVEQAGGFAYIASLMDGVPQTDSIEYYISCVQSKERRRQLLRAANRILTDASDGTVEDSEVIDHAQQVIFDLTIAGERKSFEPAAVVVQRTLEKIEERASGERCALKTGFIDLDYILGGMEKQDQIIIAGNTSMGKTGLALCIARNAAKAGHVVGYISSEMSSYQLGLRLLSMESGIDSHKLRTGDLERPDWSHLIETSRAVSELPLHIDESSGLSVAQFKAKARRFIAKTNAELLILDYLGLMHGRTRESRNQEVGEISRETKEAAKELDIPVILLSQLSRANQSRSEKRPQLSDLRDSGDIEQNADVIIFIHREEYYDETPENAGKAQIIVAKQRNGPTGDVELAFIKRFTAFENLLS